MLVSGLSTKTEQNPVVAVQLAVLRPHGDHSIYDRGGEISLLMLWAEEEGATHYRVAPYNLTVTSYALVIRRPFRASRPPIPCPPSWGQVSKWAYQAASLRVLLHQFHVRV